MYPIKNKDLRNDPRVNSDLPASISVGSQLTVKGQLKDLSLKSAFITIKNNIFLNIGDEVGFSIQCSSNVEDMIKGLARISRIVPGEGLVVYFTKMDDSSLNCLKKNIQRP
jgi:hypothetical protein